jgi:hypothetical protein
MDIAAERHRLATEMTALYRQAELAHDAFQTDIHEMWVQAMVLSFEAQWLEEQEND